MHFYAFWRDFSAIKGNSCAFMRCFFSSECQFHRRNHLFEAKPPHSRHAARPLREVKTLAPCPKPPFLSLIDAIFAFLGIVSRETAAFEHFLASFHVKHRLFIAFLAQFHIQHATFLCFFAWFHVKHRFWRRLGSISRRTQRSRRIFRGISRET